MKTLQDLRSTDRNIYNYFLLTVKRRYQYRGLWHVLRADRSGCAVYGVGLRQLACWNCGFESRRRYGLVSVVCCREEISASGWSLVQRSSTDCGVSECDREVWIMRRPWHTRGLFGAWKKKEWLTKWVGCGRRRLRLNRCSNLKFVGTDYGKRGTPSVT